jgi:hypothetical protein
LIAVAQSKCLDCIIVKTADAEVLHIADIELYIYLRVKTVSCIPLRGATQETAAAAVHGIGAFEK